MGGFQLRKASVVISATSLLMCQTGAHTVSQHLRSRKLQQSQEYKGCFADTKNDRIFEMDSMVSHDNMNSEFCMEFCVMEGAQFFATQFGSECWCSDIDDLNYARHEESMNCNMPCSGNEGDENEICGGRNAMTVYAIVSSDDGSAGDDEGAADDGDDEGAADDGDDEGAADDGDDEGAADDGDDEGAADDGDEGAADDGDDGEGEPLDDLVRDYRGCYADDPNDRIFDMLMVSRDGMNSEVCMEYCIKEGGEVFATQYGFECWCSGNVDVDYDRLGGSTGCDVPCSGNEGNENEICGGRSALNVYTLVPSGGGGGEDLPTSGGDDGGGDDGGDDGGDSDFYYDDIVGRKNVEGYDSPGGVGWADSYSIDGACYMRTTFDHAIGIVVVSTPRGDMTIKDLYDLLLEVGGPFPSSEGRPLYNDIQCGNGPPNNHGDEERCPGLVLYDADGCRQYGPMWDLSVLE